MKKVICKFCKKEFSATRSDAKRCPECYREKHAEYNRSPKAVAQKKERYRKLRETVIIGYGGECECCGEKRFEFLSIDHKNGGGRKERKMLSIQQILLKIIKLDFPPEYRVLCHNCNQALGWYGYCPHKGKRTA